MVIRISPTTHRRRLRGWSDLGFGFVLFRGWRLGSRWMCDTSLWQSALHYTNCGRQLGGSRLGSLLCGRHYALWYSSCYGVRDRLRALARGHYLAVSLKWLRVRSLPKSWDSAKCWELAKAGSLLKSDSLLRTGSSLRAWSLLRSGNLSKFWESSKSLGTCSELGNC